VTNLKTSDVHILLVEDNPRFLQALKEELLEEYGYRHLYSARDTDEAKEKLSQRPFEIIIADMRLGGDVGGGFAVLDEVKTRNITSVVIIFTANDTVRDCRKAFKEDAWDYVPKNIHDPIGSLDESIQTAITYFNRWGGKREDEAWIEKHMVDLLDDYRGQYIAVLNNSVLASAATEEALNQELGERKLPLFLPVTRKIGTVRPIADLIKLGESATLEFKSALRWDVKQNKRNDGLQFSVLKTIVAFLNCDGGTLLIGVQDDGGIFGLERDISFVKGKTLDGFEQTLMNLIHAHIGAEYIQLIQVRFEIIDGKDVCAVEVSKATQWACMKKKQSREFYIREGNGSRSLDVEEAINYVQIHGSRIVL